MSLTLELSESEIKIVLEALTTRERQMAETCATSDDEDLVAEVGNDLIELRLLLSSLRSAVTARRGALRRGQRRTSSLAAVFDLRSGPLLRC